MKILSFESTAKAASVALCDGEFLVAQSYQNSGLTHSTTLLPMAEAMLKNCGSDLSGVNYLAVAVGPGSFTGLRIGISTVKGLSWGREIPCVGVSTLEAMAWPMAHVNGLLCCAMDARRNQVYNALFLAHDGALERLTPDRAISLEELYRDISGRDLPVILVGDGAMLCYDSFKKQEPAEIRSLALAPEHLHYQSAWGVAKAALEGIRRGEVTDGAGLEARYLRLSQAERERLERMNLNEKE